MLFYPQIYHMAYLCTTKVWATTIFNELISHLGLACKPLCPSSGVQEQGGAEHFPGFPKLYLF